MAATADRDNAPLANDKLLVRLSWLALAHHACTACLLRAVEYANVNLNTSSSQKEKEKLKTQAASISHGDGRRRPPAPEISIHYLQQNFFLRSNPSLKESVRRRTSASRRRHRAFIPAYYRHLRIYNCNHFNYRPIEISFAYFSTRDGLKTLTHALKQKQTSLGFGLFRPMPIRQRVRGDLKTRKLMEKTRRAGD